MTTQKKEENMAKLVDKAINKIFFSHKYVLFVLINVNRLLRIRNINHIERNYDTMGKDG